MPTQQAYDHDDEAAYSADLAVWLEEKAERVALVKVCRLVKEQAREQLRDRIERLRDSANETDNARRVRQRQASTAQILSHRAREAARQRRTYVPVNQRARQVLDVSQPARMLA